MALLSEAPSCWKEMVSVFYRESWKEPSPRVSRAWDISKAPCLDFQPSMQTEARRVIMLFDRQCFATHIKEIELDPNNSMYE